MIIDFRAIVPFFCEIQYNELEKINSKVELKNESVHLIDINSNIYDYSDEKASKFDMIFEDLLDKATIKGIYNPDIPSVDGYCE